MDKILIIDDDVYIRHNIEKILAGKHYEVYTADSVGAVQRVLSERGRMDLYLIDVILPDGSGFDICRALRRRGDKAPVIFLTSCDDEESITMGLDIGGDDYIVKPFRTAELISRMRANLRRIQMHTTVSEKKQNEWKRYQYGELEIDAEQCTVLRGGQVLNLTKIELELLEILIRNSGLIVKRSVLLEKVWDSNGNFVEDNTLTVAVSRLKSKLGNVEAKGGCPYIETIRGIGYRWTGKEEQR